MNEVAFDNTIVQLCGAMEAKYVCDEQLFLYL